MDEYTADAFVNRDDPIPLLTVPTTLQSDSPSENESSKRDKLKKNLSASHLKDKLHDKAASKAAGADTSSSLQDRLLNKYDTQRCHEVEEKS